MAYFHFFAYPPFLIFFPYHSALYKHHAGNNINQQQNQFHSRVVGLSLDNPNEMHTIRLARECLNENSAGNHTTTESSIENFEETFPPLAPYLGFLKM
jgi:hypothetical protein